VCVCDEFGCGIETSTMKRLISDLGFYAAETKNMFSSYRRKNYVSLTKTTPSKLLENMMFIIIMLQNLKILSVQNSEMLYPVKLYSMTQ
jgi:hypothetical protein